MNNIVLYESHTIGGMGSGSIEWSAVDNSRQMYTTPYIFKIPDGVSFSQEDFSYKYLYGPEGWGHEYYLKSYRRIPYLETINQRNGEVSHTEIQLIQKQKTRYRVGDYCKRIRWHDEREPEWAREDHDSIYRVVYIFVGGKVILQKFPIYKNGTYDTHRELPLSLDNDFRRATPEEIRNAGIKEKKDLSFVYDDEPMPMWKGERE